MTTDTNIEEKLTPSAREALDEILASYREQLLLASVQSASSLTGDFEEISVRDILESANELRFRRVTRSTSMQNRMTGMFVPAGIIYAFLGLFIFIYTTYRFTFEFEQWLSLMITFSGILLVFAGWWFQKSRMVRTADNLLEARYGSETNNSLQFIQYWMEIELLLRDIVASSLGESAANVPVSKLISEVRRQEFLSESEENVLRELLNLRNLVLHKGFEPDKDDVEEINRKFDAIMKQLKRVRTGK